MRPLAGPPCQQTNATHHCKLSGTNGSSPRAPGSFSPTQPTSCPACRGTPAGPPPRTCSLGCRAAIPSCNFFSRCVMSTILVMPSVYMLLSPLRRALHRGSCSLQRTSTCACCCRHSKGPSTEAAAPCSAKHGQCGTTMPLPRCVCVTQSECLVAPCSSYPCAITRKCSNPCLQTHLLHTLLNYLQGNVMHAVSTSPCSCIHKMCCIQRGSRVWAHVSAAIFCSKNSPTCFVWNKQSMP